MNERYYPVGSYYLAGSKKINVSEKLGFGRWELQNICSPDGKYYYLRVA